MKFEITKEKEFTACYFINCHGIDTYRKIICYDEGIRQRIIFGVTTHNKYLLDAGRTFMIKNIPDNWNTYCTTKESLIDFITSYFADFMDGNKGPSSTNEEYATYCILQDIINNHPELFSDLTIRRNDNGAKNDFDIIDGDNAIVHILEHKYFANTTDAGQSMKFVKETLLTDEFYKKIAILLIHKNNVIIDVKIVPFWMFIKTNKDTTDNLRFQLNKGKGFGYSKWQISNTINTDLLNLINDPYNIDEVKTVMSNIYDYTEKYYSLEKTSKSVSIELVNNRPHYIPSSGVSMGKHCPMHMTNGTLYAVDPDTKKTFKVSYRTYNNWLKTLDKDLRETIDLVKKSTNTKSKSKRKSYTLTPEQKQKNAENQRKRREELQITFAKLENGQYTKDPKGRYIRRAKPSDFKGLNIDPSVPGKIDFVRPCKINKIKHDYTFVEYNKIVDCDNPDMNKAA